MPRQQAPPPSGEFNVRVEKPFSGDTTHVIDITGEPNRPAQINWTDSKDGTSLQKTGSMPADDVEELLRLVNGVRGFPSSGSKDVYGLDAKLELSTFEIQWSNAETDPTADTIGEVAAETKDEFKRVVDSIESAARQFAKQDKAV